MAIPAGHIGRVFAHQVLRAADHVFEDMVQRMADMHVAIGIGRAIVEDELLTPNPRLAQLGVEVNIRPARRDARLLLREASFHGKGGLGQEDRVFIIALFRHKARPLGHSRRAGKGH